MKYVVDGTTPEDLADVAGNLSDGAKAAYEAAGLDPLKALTEALQMSQVRSIVMVDPETMDMEVLGVFGWWPCGYIWLTLTPEFFQHAHKFARRIRLVTDAMVAQLGQCYMYIDERIPRDVRFAKFLGFSPGDRFTTGDIEFTIYTRTA